MSVARMSQSISRFFCLGDLLGMPKRENISVRTAAIVALGLTHRKTFTRWTMLIILLLGIGN